MRTYSVTQSGLLSLCCQLLATLQRPCSFIDPVLGLWTCRSPALRLRTQMLKAYVRTYQTNRSPRPRHSVATCVIVGQIAATSPSLCYAQSQITETSVKWWPPPVQRVTLRDRPLWPTYVDDEAHVRDSALQCSKPTRPLVATATLSGNLTYRLTDCCNNCLYNVGWLGWLGVKLGWLGLTWRWLLRLLQQVRTRKSCLYSLLLICCGE